MHILLIADGRSPTTLSWLDNLLASGQWVSLASSYACKEPAGLEHFELLPLAGSGLRPSPDSGASGSSLQRLGRLRPLLLRLRHQLGPLTLARPARRLAELCAAWQPDLVHGLRIPFEGMLAARAPADFPVAVSIWGNDLTLHAGGSPLMASETRRTLRRAAGLLADTSRDLALAPRWGLRDGAPTACVPGSGGLDLEAVDRAATLDLPLPSGWLQPDDLLVLNPRGLRTGSLRTDVFFQALPGFLDECARAKVACLAMQGEPEAETLRAELHRWSPQSAGRVLLLPRLPQAQVWRLMHRADVLVSPSAHDGTPNSLLEGLACGCFPVAGDIASMREWITPGENGLLYPPQQADALSAALLQAAGSQDLRRSAARSNRETVTRRAGRQAVQPVVAAFYEQVIRSS